MSRLYWIVAAAALLLLLVLKVFHFGYDTAVSEQLALDNSRLREAFEQGQELGTVRDRVVTEYVEKIVTVYKQGATIVKEIPVYVSKAADAACVVPAGFVRVHDASAANVPVSGGPLGTDDGPSGIALSTVAGTVADNYTICRANAEQLKALQKWVRESHAITNRSDSGE